MSITRVTNNVIICFDCLDALLDLSYRSKSRTSYHQT